MLLSVPVAPHVDAWIEIVKKHLLPNGQFVAPHVGAWIEILAWIK